MCQMIHNRSVCQYDGEILSYPAVQMISIRQESSLKPLHKQIPDLEGETVSWRILGLQTQLCVLLLFPPPAPHWLAGVTDRDNRPSPRECSSQTYEWCHLRLCLSAALLPSPEPCYFMCHTKFSSSLWRFVRLNNWYDFQILRSWGFHKLQSNFSLPILRLSVTRPWNVEPDPAQRLT